MTIQTSSSVIHVAAGIVINSAQQILVAQRTAGREHAGLWEFPGGKLEPGETVLDALRRELDEEVGIQVQTAQAWLETEYQYAKRPVHLHVWQVLSYVGEPHGREGQPVRWVSYEELKSLALPEANISIMERLPELWVDMANSNLCDKFFAKLAV